MDYIKIRNWERWQTYRADRGQPPWIKIHRRIMRNPDWVALSDAERGQLVAMWLLAADHDGVIPASPQIVQKLCFMSGKPNFKKFSDLGFLSSNGSQDGVKLASNGSQDDSPEAKAEAETEAKTDSCSDGGEKVPELTPFEKFWINYPRKEGKKEAMKAWEKVKNPEEVIERLKLILPKQKKLPQWTKEKGQFIPLPTSYINQKRWEDEI